MEEGSSTVEVTFVFLMILLCLAGFVAAGIRTHDATMAVVAAEAFLQDETAVDADLEQLADAVGNVFTDPCMISTTTDINVACNFSDTLFIIYASREAMEDLGAISIDSFIHTNEKEILMCENAEYRLLDVGTMAVESTDSEGQQLTLYRNYVTVELLGSGE